MRERALSPASSATLSGDRTAPATVARLIVDCLENEGVEYRLRAPRRGEPPHDRRPRRLVDPVRHDPRRARRGVHGRHVRRAHRQARGVPGDARAGRDQPDARASRTRSSTRTRSSRSWRRRACDRIYKESHQFVDLVSLYRPVTKWGDMVTLRDAAPEMVRKAFKQATTERPGGHVPRPARGRRGARDRRAPAPRERARRSLALGGPGAPRRPGARAGRHTRGARRPRRRARRRDRRRCSGSPSGSTSRRDDVPGQGGLPRRPSERARHDRVHGQGLRELRIRPRRRGGGGRLRPGRVLAVAMEPVPATSGSSTCTGRSPRSTRTTRWRWGCRARSARRSTRSVRRPSSTTSEGRSHR